MGEVPIRVACLAETDNVTVPEGLCDAFADAVASAANRPAEIVPEPETADLVLRVSVSAPYALTAGIEGGAPRSIRRRGAPLGPEAYAVFLEGLLEQVAFR